MDRSEAEKLASQDLVFRYGLADLIASGYETTEEAAETRIRELGSYVRAYVEPKGYDNSASGTASSVSVNNLSSQKGEQVKENGYQRRPHVLKGGLNRGRVTLVTAIQNGKPKDRGKLLQRYYPHVAKLTMGSQKQAKNTKAPRFARQLAFITTLTPHKPSRIVNPEENVRGSLLPDLPLESLVHFVRTFRDAPGPGLSWEMRNGKPQLKERDGNFMSAPPSWAFTPVGLAAAASDWVEEARFDRQARRLIKKISDCRWILVGEKGVQPQTFNEVPHLASRASEAKDLIHSAWKVTSDLGESKSQYFYLTLSRFLHRFDWHSLGNFLSTRAEYPGGFDPFLTSFFIEFMDEETVLSAKSAGKHANVCCWKAAENNDSYKDKQTFLDEIESVISSAESGPEMLARFSTQVGRMPGGDFPEAAELFFEKLNQEEVDLQKAKHVLRSFLRIGRTKQNTSTTNDNGSEFDYNT